MCFSLKTSLCKMINHSFPSANWYFAALKWQRGKKFLLRIFSSPRCIIGSGFRKHLNCLTSRGCNRWAHCKLWEHIWKYLIFWPMTHSLTLIPLYKGLMYSRINMLSDRFYISEFLCWSVFSLLTTYVSNIPYSSSSIWIYSLILVLIVEHYS